MPVCHAGLIPCVLAVKTSGIVGVLSHPTRRNPTQAGALSKVHACTDPEQHSHMYTHSRLLHVCCSHTHTHSGLTRISLSTVSSSLVTPFCLSSVHSISSSPFVPSSFRLPHLHPSSFISSCSAPPLVPAECTWVTLSRWQPGEADSPSTPTGLGIALLSASLDQIALTVYQQTRRDSGPHSRKAYTLT